MKKLCVLALVAGLLSGMMAAGVCFAEGDAMTHLQFAQLVANKAGVTLPAGSEQLSEADLYTALANALAEKGIANFQGKNAGDPVNFSFVIEVVYIMVGGTEALDLNGKVDYLVTNGFLVNAPGDLNAEAGVPEVQAIFDNPAVSGLIAETYTPPAGPGAPAGIPGAGAPGTAGEYQPQGTPASPV